MDWMIVSASVIAAWLMLSVISGERMTRQHQITSDKPRNDEPSVAVVK